MTFIASKIEEENKGAMVESGIWNHECPVKIENLRILEISHLDFSGNEHQGEMVVHELMVDRTLHIFEELYRQQFPIAKITLMENYQGDDVKSMQENNSSSFNFRKIAGTDRFSMHTYGLAVDINPVQNPVVYNPGAEQKVEPEQGVDYLDRSEFLPGMIEPYVDLFKKYGYKIWGGDWGDPKDFHHFQVEREFLDRLS